MDFDERLIDANHVSAAVRQYLADRPQHHPAKSAFLLSGSEKLPAKYILRIAFQKATGSWPKPETLTGGKASVRVLKGLGFNAIYEKPERITSNRNAIKSARREALRQILEKKFGPVETEWKHKQITVPDLCARKSMRSDLRQILDAIESFRGIAVQGRKEYKLRYDLYVSRLKQPIEFDERQHFTPLRAAGLKSYPKGIRLGFDKGRWIQLSEEIRAGDNSPAYRDEQRAFYDSVRDILAPEAGLRPVARIFEEDVAWEKDACNTSKAQEFLESIRSIH